MIGNPGHYDGIMMGHSSEEEKDGFMLKLSSDIRRIRLAASYSQPFQNFPSSMICFS